MRSFKNILTVFKREVFGYLTSPMAYVFIAIFVALNMAFGFLFSNFLKKGDASLVDFFMWHPWFYMLIGPAMGMRLWSEEQRLGTMELLMTFPIAVWEVIVGKFLAAASILFLALLMTFSMVVTVHRLGDPDNGLILCGYMGSFLVGASSLAITCAVSAFTRSQVACLIISFFINLLLILCGFGPIQEFISKLVVMGVSFEPLAQPLALGGYLYHSNLLGQGLFKLQSLVYFASLIGFSLFLTSVIIRSKRS
jgi:ABC-2 type transport system permease protein